MLDLNPAAVALFFVAFHMFGDYVFQIHWMAMNKFVAPQTQSERGGRDAVARYAWAAYVRTLHVGAYTGLFAALAFLTLPPSQAWLMVAAIFIPHWITDCRRWPASHPWPMKSLLVDQSLHAMHLAIVFAVFYG